MSRVLLAVFAALSTTIGAAVAEDNGFFFLIGEPGRPLGGRELPPPFKTLLCPDGMLRLVCLLPEARALWPVDVVAARPQQKQKTS